MDAIPLASPRRRTSPKTNLTTGPPSSVPGTIPTNSSVLSRALASNGRHVYPTGRVFYSSGTTDHSCSAGIVSSNTGDLIVTAGHYVFSPITLAWLDSNWVFVPAYSNGNRPYGTWPARDFFVLPAWTSNRNFNYDMAFVALSTLYRWHIQSYLGSQGIGFNLARLQYIYSFGYPGNINNAETRSQCVAYAEDPIGSAPEFLGQRLPCNMGQGASGGPWLQGVNEATGVGYMTSVNSFVVAWIPLYMYGPYFDSAIGSLYNLAKNN